VRFSNDSAFIGRKLGLNRREHRLYSRRALERLEPDEAKVSRPVLRGGSGGNAALLPDLHSTRRALVIRQYLPKGTNLSWVTQAQCDRIVERLNNRPRLRLGFKTSNEAYF
jgi:hypothetical protein